MKDAPRHMGYRAAARGQPLDACPFMKVSELPTHTGESFTHWRAKVEAWEQGWYDCVNERPALTAEEAANNGRGISAHPQ
ncbi:CrpP-related protein [Achromobacter xylosoxidans]|uniref:CrpP-related protein n=1 Tax=Alcaligenes xylosoxydans xylosoxydans TaxID=85698 RepID=UPI0034E00849